MALGRMVGVLCLSETSVALRGSVTDVPDACATVIPYVAYEYSKTLTELSGLELAAVDACRDMLQAMVNAEESCVGRRVVREFHLSAPLGVVNQVNAYVDGPSVGPRTLGIWGWRKGRADFSSGEHDQLDDLVALAVSFMEAEEPVP